MADIETKAPAPAGPAPKPVATPAPVASKVKIVSKADDTVVVTTAVGEVTLEPGKPVEVDAALAEQTAYLPKVEVV